MVPGARLRPRQSACRCPGYNSILYRSPQEKGRREPSEMRQKYVRKSSAIRVHEEWNCAQNSGMKKSANKSSRVQNEARAESAPLTYRRIKDFDRHANDPRRLDGKGTKGVRGFSWRARSFDIRNGLSLSDNNSPESVFKIRRNFFFESAGNLLDLRRRLAEKGGHPPQALAVIVGLSSAAYRRQDGVCVLPITALKP